MNNRKYEFERKKKEFIIDISVSSATVLAFVYQSTFLYGYIFLMFQENRQHHLHDLHPENAVDSLCPVLPILEIYLHSVAVTSILAFLLIGAMYTSSLSPSKPLNAQINSLKTLDVTSEREDIASKSNNISDKNIIIHDNSQSTQELLPNQEEIISIKPDTSEKGQSMNKQDNEFHTNGDETCDAAINRNRSNLTRPLFWILAASHGVWQVVGTCAVIYLHLTIDSLHQNVHTWVKSQSCSLAVLWFCTLMILAEYVIFLSLMVWVIFQVPKEASRVARQELLLLSIKNHENKKN